MEFPGAIVLVTHDRFLLDRVSNVVFGLDGFGGAERFADYRQWEEWQREQQAARNRAQEARTMRTAAASGATSSVPTKKKLTYKEEREFATMEQAIANAESVVRERLAALRDPAIASDGTRLHAASVKLEEAQKAVDQLYERWAELDAKLK